MQKIFLLLVAIACSMPMGPARAAESRQASASQAYPNRPLRIVVPTGAGGITDILARIVAQKLTVRLGQQVLVDNRTGASGIVGSEIVAKAAPDGYTLLMVFPTHVVNPTLFAKLPYDTVKDFAPVTMVSSVTLVLIVNAASPLKSVREVIAAARARPGELTYGTTGNGSLAHLGAELFKSMTGTQMTHVPYKGVPQITTALLSNEITIFFDTPITSLPQIKAGKVRPLGVSTRTRLAVLPDVPTIAEAGVPNYEAIGWNGILAPAGTPFPVIERLHKEIVEVLRSQDVIEQLAAQGTEPVANTPAEFSAILQRDMDKWGALLKGAGIKAD